MIRNWHRDARTRIYVGSPNDTHQITAEYLSRIHSWAADIHLTGYTVYDSGVHGFWEGTGEQTVIVEIMGHSPNGEQLQILRQKLNQQALFITTEPVLAQLVS